MTRPLSIVLTVPGDLPRVWRCIESLAAQPGEPQFELVVADMGAPGLDRLVARLEGDLVWLPAARRLSVAQALNSAVQGSTAETLVLLDGAPFCSAGIIAGLVAELDRGAVAATVGSDRGRHPSQSPVVAVRRADLLRIGGVPDVSDDRAFAALLLELTGVGEVAVSAGPGAITSGLPPAPPRHDLTAGPEVSIVIPTLEAAGDRVRACLRAIAATTAEPHEVIVVDNGSSPQGYTRPVNAGVRAASGAAIVVMNDDVEPLPGWWPPLRAALAAGAEVVFPRTVEGATREDFAAWCFAFDRRAIDRFGVRPGEFLDTRFTVWFQDTDLLMRLRAAGSPPVHVPESTIRHALSQTVNTQVPELAAWIRGQITIDAERFARKHPGAMLAPRA